MMQGVAIEAKYPPRTRAHRLQRYLHRVCGGTIYNAYDVFPAHAARKERYSGTHTAYNRCVPPMRVKLNSSPLADAAHGCYARH